MITIKEFKDNDISFFFINKLIKDNIIERASKGIYNKTEDFEDDYFIIQNRYNKTVFSYNTALFSLGKTEVTPNRIDITVPKGYNAHRIKDKYRIHYISKKYFDLGLIEITTPFGNKVKCYNLERTICDLVRSNKAGLDTEQINKVIRNAFLKNQINSIILKEYAVKLKCNKKIQALTEVLA